MSLNQSVANALSGLTATSRMAETVAANLANALTDGYGRRIVELSAQTSGFDGAGVRVDGIARLADRGLLAERRNAESRHEADSITATVLARVDRALGDAEAGTSLAARIAALQAALVAAGGDPSSDVALAGVLDRLGGVASGLRAASATIQTERLEADRRIAADVASLNHSLSALEKLNGDVVTAHVTGADPSALMDQRQILIDRIARIVPVREITRENGRIALVTPGGEVLIDGRTKQYEFTSAATVTADMTLQSGGLSGLMQDGQPVPGTAGIGRLDGGTLGAAMHLRDVTLPTMSADLDRLAADLIARFTDPATDPTLAPGMAGLFTEAGAPMAPLAPEGLAGRIAVNAAIDPDLGGALWRLRDGVNAASPGPVGSATQISNWSDALARPAAFLSGGPIGSAADHAARIAAGAARDRLTAEEAQAWSAARWHNLRVTELAQGVDTDQELQMLLRIEQAYAANAKTLATIDEMFRILLEI